jgi:hypothetical protein
MLIFTIGCILILLTSFLAYRIGYEQGYTAGGLYAIDLTFKSLRENNK